MQTAELQEWITKDTPPESGKRVLIVWENSNDKKRVSLGFYAAKHSVVDQNEEDRAWDITDYSEENDEYYFPEGWYEIPHEVEFFGRLSNVTHWMDIPTLPCK